jgi:hypothetical protein
MPNNLRSVRERLTTLALLIVGIAIFILSLAANWIGLGHSPGFGWKKQTLLCAGLFLSTCGVWRLWITQARERLFPAVPADAAATEPSRPHRPRIDVGLLVILALPWALLFASVNWIFDYEIGTPFIDAWLYFGFFLDLPGYLRAFPETYYGSRLPWILPGYEAHKLFTPIIATYALHFGLYYTTAASFYLTLKHTVGRRAALLATIGMGSYGFFLWAMGSDYVEGPAIAYFLLTTLALTNTARRLRPWAWLALGGTFYGAMVYTNLFLVVFTPPLLLYYLAVNWQQNRHSLKVSSLFFTSGFLAISVLLGAVSYALGGDLLFYAPSIRSAHQLATQLDPWKYPVQTWLSGATWLVLPSLAVLSSMALLIVAWKARSGRTNRFLILFQIYFLMCASIMLLWDLRGGATLQETFYASLLIPPMFLAWGAQLASMTDRLSSRNFIFLVCGVLAICLLAYRVPGDSHLTVFLSTHAPWLALVLALAAGTTLLLSGAAARTATLSIMCVTLALANVASGAFRTKNARMSKPGFLAIVDTVQAIRTLEPSGKVLFWYQLSEPQGNYYRSVSSTYLWGFSLIGEQFPSLERDKRASQPPGPDRPLVILTTENDALLKAQASLRQIGLGAELLTERRIQEESIGWNLFFIKLHDWPFIEEIRFTPDEWPESFSLRWESQERRTVELRNSEVTSLFQSDMTGNTDWLVNRYGGPGGLDPQQNCLASGDGCGLYHAGDPRDHLSSPFATLPVGQEFSVFFTIWVKPYRGTVMPRIFLQNERFDTLAESTQLKARGDGWVLRGGWLQVRNARQLRMVVTQPLGSSSLLDKALLVQIPDPSPAKPAAPATTPKRPDRLSPG